MNKKNYSTLLIRTWLHQSFGIVLNRNRTNFHTIQISETEDEDTHEKEVSVVISVNTNTAPFLVIVNITHGVAVFSIYRFEQGVRQCRMSLLPRESFVERCGALLQAPNLMSQVEVDTLLGDQFLQHIFS